MWIVPIVLVVKLPVTSVNFLAMEQPAHVHSTNPNAAVSEPSVNLQ
jgi:hypothetical protein